MLQPGNQYRAAMTPMKSARKEERNEFHHRSDGAEYSAKPEEESRSPKKEVDTEKQQEREKDVEEYFFVRNSL